MRPLNPSFPLKKSGFGLAASLLLLGVALAQNTGTTSNVPQLPVGQTFKQFEFPIYQEGVLKATLTAAEARGITLNRAETTDLKIEVYENGAITSTITSPDADLYVAEQKLRTKNTVRIDRSDLIATAQTCDFDLPDKKYVMRTNVKVILKNFDVGSGIGGKQPATNSASSIPPTTGIGPVPPTPAKSVSP